MARTLTLETTALDTSISKQRLPHTVETQYLQLRAQIHEILI